MLTRQVDFLKGEGVTALFTSLDQEATPGERRPADRVAHRHLAAA